jgi:hypothetical protein
VERARQRREDCTARASRTSPGRPHPRRYEWMKRPRRRPPLPSAGRRSRSRGRRRYGSSRAARRGTATGRTRARRPSPASARASRRAAARSPTRGTATPRRAGSTGTSRPEDDDHRREVRDRERRRPHRAGGRAGAHERAQVLAELPPATRAQVGRLRDRAVRHRAARHRRHATDLRSPCPRRSGTTARPRPKQRGAVATADSATAMCGVGRSSARTHEPPLSDTARHDTRRAEGSDRSHPRSARPRMRGDGCDRRTAAELRAIALAARDPRRSSRRCYSLR